jgi:hypothetical protein
LPNLKPLGVNFDTIGFEMRFPRPPGLFYGHFLSVNGKCMTGSTVYRDYVSAPLTVAPAGAQNQKAGMLLFFSDCFVFFKSIQRPHLVDAGRRRRHNMSSVS